MNKKMISSVLLASMLILVARPATKVTEAATFVKGDGTSQSPYIITNAEQLVSIKNDLSAHYSLGSNIDLSKIRDLSPIGTVDKPFIGNFNGEGYSISGIAFEKSCNEKNNYIGLFGVSMGDIRDFTIRGKIEVNNNYNTVNRNAPESKTNSVCDEVIVTTLADGTEKITVAPTTSSSNTAKIDYIESETYIGGLVGYNKGTVSNITSTIEIVAKGNGTIYCGGIVGYNLQGKIENCTSNAKISSYTGETGFIPDVNFGRNYCGGIVGYSYSGKISGCENYSEIRSYNGLHTKTSYACAGGIVGHSEWGKTELSNCFNEGNIYAQCDSNYNCSRALAGGMTGGFRGIANMCVNKGSIFAENTNYGSARAGGIAASASGQISKCYNRGVVKVKKVSENKYAVSDAGGIVGGLFSDTYFDINSKIEYCINAALNVEATGSEALAGRIIGSRGKDVISSFNYSLSGSKVNGSAPASNIGESGNNGKNVGESELPSLLDMIMQ